MVWTEVDTPLLGETGINVDIGEPRPGAGEHVRNGFWMVIPQSVRRLGGLYLRPRYQTN